MTRNASYLYGLLAFFDPLLSLAPLVVEPHYRPAGGLPVGHDEPHLGEQLPEVELHFRHYPSRRLPTGRLIQGAFVPDHRFVARSSYGPRQQLRDVPLPAVVGGGAGGILHPPFLPRPLDL